MMATYKRHLILDSGKSYRYISNYLQSLYPDARGLSERSARRCCAKHGICRVSGPELDFHVSNAVQELGPAYGVKTMSGYLDSKGVKVTTGAWLVAFRNLLDIVNVLSRGPRTKQRARRLCLKLQQVQQGFIIFNFISTLAINQDTRLQSTAN